MNIITTAAREAHQADEQTQPRLDAEFLASQVSQNERYTKHGINRDDLHVLFKMDWCSQAGRACSHRFSRALKRLMDDGLATQRGDRYYPPTAEVGTLPAGRECAATSCRNDISHKRSGTRFCSARCKRFDQRLAHR
jgi:hypothetical protein